MGKSDIAVKNWLANKARFADLFNGVIFEGRQIILPDELTIMNSETNFIVRDKSDKKRDKSVQRYRDITMSWKQGIVFMVLACEVQDKIHYAMPVRNMLYDSLSYIEQMKDNWNILSDTEKRGLNSEEFFSRFREKDKLRPVITIVFYYGKTEWDGNVDLYSMLDITQQANREMLLRYIPNYKINVIEPMKINDLSRFKTDLQMIIGVLKCRQDKDEILRYININKEYFSAVDIETAYAIESMLKSDKLVRSSSNETEVCDMCKALEDLYNDGVAEGKLEGKLQGKLEGGLETNRENIVEFLADYGCVPESLSKKITTQEDVQVLKKWVKLSARVSSIEQFEDMMDKV